MRAITSDITHKVVKRNDSANERREVHDEELVVRGDGEGTFPTANTFACLFCCVKIWQEVEDVLQIVDDLVVDG